MTADGQAHLLDVGIAKLLSEVAAGEAGLTQQQGRVMTPHYASPEQVAGEAITVQSDVYSLGVLLYELLTGTLPIAPRRGTLGAVEDAILEGDAPLASSRVRDKATARALRGEVDAILAKSMQREPERRYATADALTQDIERHLNGEVVAARADSLGYRLCKTVRRHWVGVAAAAAVLVAVLSGVGVAVVQAQWAARSAERERVVKEFVADVFRVNSRVDPRNAALRPSSTLALLEGGAQLIQQRFAGQPELQAELFGVVGGVFSDMGAYRLATEYCTRRVEALATLRAEQTKQAEGLLALAQALFDDRSFADAELRVRRTIEMAGRETATHLSALVLLGRIQDAEARYDALEATLRDIEAKLGSPRATPVSGRAWALFLRAQLLTVRNLFNEALPVYQQAVAAAVLSEGRLSLTAVELELTLARRLAATPRAKEAQAHFLAAAETLRELGGAHEIRRSFEAARFDATRQLAFSQITAIDAISTLKRSRTDLAATTLPIPPWFIPKIDFWTGEVLIGDGNVAEGGPLLEAAAPALRAAATTLYDQYVIVGTMGYAAMLAGRHDLADGLLRERMKIRRLRGQGTHPRAAGDHYMVAENLMMQGRTDKAESALDEAPHFEPMRGEGLDGDRYGRLLLEERAAVRLAAGKPIEALQLLRRVPPAADGSGDSGNYNERLGEALCAIGQAREGLGLLKQQVADSERDGSYPNAPWSARLRAITGLCAFANGDRTSALRYATQARAAFTAQPGVSPYYKAPLFKLERALGLKLPPV